MAHIEGHEDMHGFVKRWNHSEDGFQHWKYPETVGNDTSVDNINFNSHDSSEYAIERMSAIDELTREPFIFFEFMKIKEDKAAVAIKNKTDSISSSFAAWAGRDRDPAPGDDTSTYGPVGQGSGVNEEIDLQVANSWVDKSVKAIAAWFKDLVHTAERDYIGSVALYMPTDIQINDTMVYNEDTRRIGALMEAISEKDAKIGDVLNPTILLQPEVLALITAGLGEAAKFAKVGGSTVQAVTTLASYGIGDILSTEMQRSSGKIMNPNELLSYQQTALRSFTFNWIFLPDNEYESNQATNIIKMFRKAAHATKMSSTMITVPDHVIVSFHGAKDMVQIPPCYIEGVNVTYNPNVSSFFKRNNAPVEIGLSLTIKEIVPIYSEDVEKRGY